jgi:hypothetical protein
MSDDSFDLDDPESLFDPYKYASDTNIYKTAPEEENKANSPPQEAEVADVASNGEGNDEPQPAWPITTKYPNLQVTQDMIRPKRLRREKSAIVDCFQ